jgi:hypothetical protein
VARSRWAHVVTTVLEVYGGLKPEADTALQERLDAMAAAAKGKLLRLASGSSGPKVVPEG